MLGVLAAVRCLGVDRTAHAKRAAQQCGELAGSDVAAKAQAFLQRRNYVAPDDIAAILPQTAAHRLVPVSDAGRGAMEQVRAMIDATPIP